MIKELRDQFNRNFSEKKYYAYADAISNLHPGALEFRIAETPVFIPRRFKNTMLETCEEIIDVISSNRFDVLTRGAIPPGMHVHNDKGHTQFIVFDFGICEGDNGQPEPQLIELQGFPSLFGFEVFHSALTRDYANVTENFDSYLNGYDELKYVRLLKDIIIGNDDPQHVILLDIFPEEQKTRIDFYCTEDLLGIKTVCLTKIISRGNKLFYNQGNELIEIKRIYNRLIFDELEQLKLPVNIIDLSKNWEVEWIPHPNWFYRISKFDMPFFNHPNVPRTYILSDIKQLPADLENYVLKPLFSFAGTGVLIDVTLQDIENITDPSNWILQRKVKYSDIIQTPDVPAKAEIRIFYFWKDGWERPVAVHNLARLSKGKMIGTRYNKDREWVGSSIAFFEKINTIFHVKSSN